jgi:hypothetical protein
MQMGASKGPFILWVKISRSWGNLNCSLDLSNTASAILVRLILFDDVTRIKDSWVIFLHIPTRDRQMSPIDCEPDIPRSADSGKLFCISHLQTIELLQLNEAGVAIGLRISDGYAARLPTQDRDTEALAHLLQEVSRSLHSAPPSSPAC